MIDDRRCALGPYEESLRRKFAYRGPFDGRGIPLYRFGPPLGDRYFPILIGQYALALHERFFQDNREEDREQFLVLARWFVDNAVDAAGGAMAWPSVHPLPKWNAWPPWLSAMAQGHAISVLLRAEQLSGSSHYGELAEKAHRTFDRSITAGGVRADRTDGRIFYEEVAVEPAAHILNGMIYALWGILDFATATGNTRAATQFEEGVASVAALLPEFDSGYWSRYSLLYPNQVTSRFYHKLHVLQLTRLYERTGNAVIHAHASRWRRFADDPICRTRQAVAYRYYRLRYLAARLRTFAKLS